MVDMYLCVSVLISYVVILMIIYVLYVRSLLVDSYVSYLAILLVYNIHLARHYYTIDIHVRNVMSLFCLL